MKKKQKEQSYQLSSLLEELKDDISHISGDMGSVFTSVEYNSKDVIHGSIFVAIEGFRSDGHKYINDALDRGAGAVVLSRDRVSQFTHLNDSKAAIFASDDTRKTLSKISSSFYQHPSAGIPVIGVTGTNGKTTITYMLESILKACDYTPGVLGTINHRWKERGIQSLNTTPESKDIHEIISEMVSHGVDVVIMEVSSHGLKLSRVDDIEFDIVVFTNLTRDHLDLHETFEDYFNSKKKIFHLLDKSKKRNRAGVVNVDDDYGRAIIEDRDSFSFPIHSIGIDINADYRPVEGSIENAIEGVSYQLEKPLAGFEINLNITGRFNVYNSLCAFAVAHLMNVPVEMARKGLSSITAIPGRFDRIKSELGFHVIVDYAHTDDALHRLLQSARELRPRRIITLFGCGGNRDKTKRPVMGNIAATNSDWVIVTSDNPRDEAPEDIIRDIIHGIKGANYDVLPDREEAISRAISMAERDDMVVVAGKGHEDYQLIGGKRMRFHDHEIVKKYINKRAQV